MNETALPEIVVAQTRSRCLKPKQPTPNQETTAIGKALLSPMASFRNFTSKQRRGDPQERHVANALL